MGLFHSNNANHELARYVDARYLSDPHKGQSQTNYVFTCGIVVISWRSTKQTLVVTSSSHNKILVIHETSREYVWLR